MANVQIPNLPAVATVNGADLVEGVQSGTSSKFTLLQIATYVISQYPYPFPENPLLVTHGGTGRQTLTQYGVTYGNGASAIGITAAGTTGDVLIGNTGAAPTWSALSGVAVTTLSFGTTGLTPSTATAGAITVAGTLVPANGGTGIASYAIGDLIYASGATTLSKLADVATGNALISGGIGVAPSWGKIVLTTSVSGVLPVANGGTGVATFTLNGLVYGNTTGTLLVTAAGTTGQVLIGTTGNAPSWGTLSSLAVTTLSFGTTGLTPNSATAGAITVAGTLVVGNGGTGAASFTANGVLYGNTASAIQVTAAGTTGQYLKGNTSSAPTWGTLASDAVTTLSFGTTGLTPNSATSGAITVAGTLVAANGGTGIASYAVGDLLYASASTTLSKLAAVATGSVLVSTGAATAPAWSTTVQVSGITTTTLSASGNSSLATVTITGFATLQSGLSAPIIIEKGTNTASPATGTVQLDGLTQTILAYTTASTNNFVLNLRASSSIALNAILSNGDRLTLVFEVTNTGTPHYMTTLTIDGVTQTVKWISGLAPSAGNANAIDRYTITVNKTASATYTVTASLVSYS